MSTQIQITPASGITVGTTAVTSGTVGRIFFQGAGDVVQQDARLYWDNTNKKLTVANSFALNGSAGTGFTSMFSIFRAATEVFKVDEYKSQFTGSVYMNSIVGAGVDAILFGNQSGGGNLITMSPTQGRLAIGYGSPTYNAALDVKSTGALSTDIAFRVRNSADTGNLFDVRGNNTINMFASVNNPVLNLISNQNPTVNLYDANGIGGVIAHRYQNNPAYVSNLISQSVNIASYGVGGGQLGGAKINHFINTYNWGNTFQAQKEGGYSLYFDSTNNFETVVNSKKALWISPDKRQFIYNKTGDVVLGDTDAFCFYSDDIAAGNAAPHFRTENGNIIKLYQNAAVTSAQGIADALTNLGVLASSTIAASIPTHDGPTYDTNAIQTLTAAEYAAITPNESTLYFIV
jgi:hypothetical protein